MDFTNPQVWSDGIEIVLGAPHIVGPSLALVGVTAWWVRGRIEDGAKNELKERVNALEARLHLAHDKEMDVHDKLENAEFQLGKVRSQIQGYKNLELQSTALTAVSTISEIISISTELSGLLKVPRS